MKGLMSQWFTGMNPFQPWSLQAKDQTKKSVPIPEGLGFLLIAKCPETSLP